MDQAAAKTKVITLTLCFLFSLAGVLSASGVAGVLPVGQTEYDFIYDRNERTEALTPSRFDYQLGPYSLSSLPLSDSPFRYLLGTPAGRLLVIGLAEEEFSAAKGLEPTGWERLRGVVTGQPADKFQVYVSFLLDEKLARDEDYRGKKWRGFAGDVEQAFVSYRSSRFEITAGRFSSFWGNRRSLIIGPEQKLDGLAYSFRWGRLVLSYRLAGLDGLSPDSDSVTSFENRYFAGHRLDFHVARWLRVGLFETVLFGGPGRQIDFFYLNPLIFFHGSQLNEQLNDNTTVGFDFSFTPGQGLKVYGQLLVDDLQIDNASPSDQEPDQLGLLAGIFIADAMPSLDLRIEYTRVNNWTFNQMHERNRYLFHGKPIGSVRGNDYDEILVQADYWWRPFWRTSLIFDHIRQGEGSIQADWTAPWLDSENGYREPFPTGVVAKTSSLAARVTAFAFDHLFIDLRGGLNWLTYEAHIPGEESTQPFISLKVSSFFHTGFQPD